MTPAERRSWSNTTALDDTQRERIAEYFPTFEGWLTRLTKTNPLMSEELETIGYRFFFDACTAFVDRGVPFHTYLSFKLNRALLDARRAYCKRNSRMIRESSIGTNFFDRYICREGDDPVAVERIAKLKRFLQQLPSDQQEMIHEVYWERTSWAKVLRRRGYSTATAKRYRRDLLQTLAWKFASTA